MKDFTANYEKKENIILYEMSGYLAEAATMPMVQIAPLIKINLGKVTGLNSYGVRWWCQWIKPIPMTTKIILSECPMVFVKSFNTVSGFLTANMEVESFYVPYYSSVDETRQDILYIKEKHFGTEGLKHPVVLGKNQTPLEIDAAGNYFKFLEKKS